MFEGVTLMLYQQLLFQKLFFQMNIFVSILLLIVYHYIFILLGKKKTGKIHIITQDIKKKLIQ